MINTSHANRALHTLLIHLGMRCKLTQRLQCLAICVHVHECALEEHVACTHPPGLHVVWRMRSYATAVKRILYRKTQFCPTMTCPGLFILKLCCRVTPNTLPAQMRRCEWNSRCGPTGKKVQCGGTNQRTFTSMPCQAGSQP